MSDGKQEPMVTREGVLDCQVCVPSSWTDDQVKAFADSAYPCGTSGGWFIRRTGSEYLAGFPERVPCEERSGYVHVMLDA